MAEEEQETPVAEAGEGTGQTESPSTLKTRLEGVKRSASAFFAKLKGRLRPATK